MNDPTCSVCEFFAGLAEGEPSARRAFFTGIAVGRTLEMVSEPNLCDACAAEINATCLLLEAVARAEMRRPGTGS